VYIQYVTYCSLTCFSASEDEDDENSPTEEPLKIQVEVVETIGLSPTLAHFVQCSYSFPQSAQKIVISPIIHESISPKTDRDRLDVRFRHSEQFVIPSDTGIVDEFERGALQIKLMGHQDRYTFYYNLAKLEFFVQQCNIILLI
jgi:hypothetical protein